MIRPTEPVYLLRKIPIVECGEPLVDFSSSNEFVLDRPRFRYSRATWVRKSVFEMLRAAANELPKGIRLGVIECWRSPLIQHRLYLAAKEALRLRNPKWSEVTLLRMTNRYTAPVGTRVPPPHCTGGAVDVVLLDKNLAPLDHHSPFEPFDPASFAMNAAGTSALARETRGILSESMSRAGFTNYPSEYWHWSYGDQGWAYRGGHPHAIYGPIQPPGYVPSAEELLQEPIERA